MNYPFQRVSVCIRKPQVAFLFAVLLFMCICLSWIKQQDLAVVVLQMFQPVYSRPLPSEKTGEEVFQWGRGRLYTGFRAANTFPVTWSERVFSQIRHQNALTEITWEVVGRIYAEFVAFGLKASYLVKMLPFLH